MQIGLGPGALVFLTGCRVGQATDARALRNLGALPACLPGGDADPWGPVPAFAKAVADLGLSQARLRGDVALWAHARALALSMPHQKPGERMRLQPTLARCRRGCCRGRDVHTRKGNRGGAGGPCGQWGNGRRGTGRRVGQRGNPGDPASWKPFDFVFHYCRGLEDVIAVFTNRWEQLDTNKMVGSLFPNDADGTAWGDAVNGIGPGVASAGFTLSDPRRYQDLSDDFSAQINAFKAANAEIVTDVVIPPDFTTFWNQADMASSARCSVWISP